MIKIALWVFITFILIAILMVFGFIGWLTYQSRKHPPAYGLIVEKYYVCEAHKNLEGGIFGKGPIMKFTGKGKRNWCWREEWKEIDRKEFKILASEWYGKNWSEDIDFWQNE